MLILRRETNTPERNAIKIFDQFNNWVATIKVTESDTGSAHIGCVGPRTTKFLRAEVKQMEGKEGQHSSALEPLLHNRPNMAVA